MIVLENHLAYNFSVIHVSFLFQLSPLSTSTSSTPATTMNVTISPLNPSLSSAARNLTVTLGSEVPLSADSAPHTPSVGVSSTVESNIILPSSSILQEAALILPEKVHTLCCSGLTQLEQLFTVGCPAEGQNISLQTVSQCTR